MKIVHVVTLFTPDGAFGGPTRVALNQTRELRSRGHDVTLAGGALGYRRALPTSVDGVPVALFPARRMVPHTGFAGLTSPGLLAWLRRTIPTIDVLHVHLARDLVTLPAAVLAARAHARYVVQPHGMIDAPSNPLAGLLDVLATRRILQRAQTVFCLTDREQTEVTGLSRNPIRTTVIPNGVPAADPGIRGPRPVEVLFLARLHRRKRPTIFVQAALALTRQYPDAIFSITGPDEGESDSVTETLRTQGNPPTIRREGALDPADTLDRIRDCSVYVLPAIDEPFPMSVLEAMSVGKPVIVTRSCGLAGFVEQTRSGLVVDESVASLIAAIAELLGDDVLRRNMGANALAAVRFDFGMERIAEQLESTYADGAKVG